MNSASLVFNELENDELEMKLVFSGDNFDPNNVSHLAAAKAAEMIGKLLDETYKEDENESAK